MTDLKPLEEQLRTIYYREAERNPESTDLLADTIVIELTKVWDALFLIAKQVDSAESK